MILHEKHKLTPTYYKNFVHDCSFSQQRYDLYQSNREGSVTFLEAVKYCFNMRREISYLQAAMQYVPFILYHKKYLAISFIK